MGANQHMRTYEWAVTQTARIRRIGPVSITRDYMGSKKSPEVQSERQKRIQKCIKMLGKADQWNKVMRQAINDYRRSRKLQGSRIVKHVRIVT